MPELTLLLATPALAAQDHRLQREFARDASITGADTGNGDTVALGLGLVTGGIGLCDLAGGDDGEALEIAAESLLATAALTEVLKAGCGRRRPNRGSPDSFPSGHASFAFAAATFIAAVPPIAAMRGTGTSATSRICRPPMSG